MNIKEFWKWLWHSDSWTSYAVFLIFVFIFIKFIFFPGLSLLFGTKLPLAIVESSSMDHGTTIYGGSEMLCDKVFLQRKNFNFEEYWGVCGKWYEERNISKEEFSKFKFRNGFNKGDIMIIFGRKKIEVGDVIVFNAGLSNPVIHRVVNINPIETKGDHNPGQLNVEKDILESSVIGTAVARIPYLGWVKLFFVEIFRKIF